MILLYCLAGATTERHFLKQLLSENSLTCLFNTHRKFVAMKMDKVLVLHEGKIVESGHPKELYTQEGQFYKLMEKESDQYLNR
jgi:ABC-type multidrug transport system fused ATPase/permease subunit